MGSHSAESRLLWRASLALLAASCATQDNGAESSAGYPVLQGRFVDSGVHHRIEATEAYIGESDFYVSYLTPDGRVYAGGNWADRIDLAAIGTDVDGSYPGPYLLPLGYVQAERWPELPANPLVPYLLDIDQWARFRRQLFQSLLPLTARSGIVMHFDNDDYFFYYDENGVFEAPLFVDKPAGYSVGGEMAFDDFIRSGLPMLEAFLDSEGVSARRIVFSTGDTGQYSLPFLYVNLDQPIAVFVRHPRSPVGNAAGADSRFAQSVAHVAHSHLGGLAVRPVSSVFRLLFVAGEAVAETVRPTSLSLIESGPIPPVSNDAPMNLADWEEQLDVIAPNSATRGDIRFLIDGEDFFTRFIEVISAARESVLIRSYIFDNDDFAERIGRLLRKRADDGLEIRILLDGFGTILATGTDPEDMPDDYVPPDSVRNFLEQNSDIKVRQVRNPWLVAGDHVKTTIVDGEIAFTGGMNIGREYRYSWHDMMVETRGPVVAVLEREFEDAWTNAGPFGDFGSFFALWNRRDNDDSADGGIPLRVLLTGPGDAQIFRAQREAIRNARRYIFIENAYFTDDAMLYELALARRRGVDVRVILPLVSNHGPMNASNALAANAMLEHGIRVYLYPGMSHVKAAVFDGWGCLGSANWDNLSFHTNRELNLATSDSATVEEFLERVFDTDFEQSIELTEPFPERWSDHLTEILVDYFL